MSVNRTSLGKRISFYRSKSNLTQEALAAKVNCSREYIVQIENGTKVPSLSVLVEIATHYPFPQMSFCSTVLNILLPLQTPNFTAYCWTAMKLNRLSLFAWQKS